MQARTSRRVLVLALGSAICGVVTGVVALGVMKAMSPSADLAHDEPFLQMLTDPFVLMVWIPFTFLPALVGFLFSLWALWNVQLSKAFPATLGATVLAAAVAAVLEVRVSPVVALVAAILVMGCCRYYEPWALPAGQREPSGPSAV